MKHRTLLSLNDELTPPPRKLLAEIRKYGIPIRNGLNEWALDARSTEFNRLIELILSSSLSDKKVAISLHHNPKQGEERTHPPCSEWTPDRQITNAVLEGFDYITDDVPPPYQRNLAASFYVIGPARDAIPGVIEILTKPPKESCPISHAYPKGTYVANVHFVFFKWFFAARFYRE